MGKKVVNPFKAEKRRGGKENKNVHKSDYYSDDYRLTPDILKEASSDCSGWFDQGFCPQSDVCCSRDTCLFPNRRSRRSPAPRPPPERHGGQQPNRGALKTSKGGINSPSRSYREDSFSDCSCCDSCDFCETASHRSISSVSTTDASFYADPLPHPVHGRYPKPRTPGLRDGEERGSCGYDLACPCDKDPLNWRALGRNRGRTRRTKSFTEVNSFFECCSRIPAKNEGQLTEIDKPPARYKTKKERERENVFISPSPVRSNVRTSDSGMEQSSYSTSGGSRSQSSLSPDRRRDGRKGRQMKNKDDLLSRMVNQTREHQKQIKSLESELERLRTSGDVLMSCKVSQRDVKWRHRDVLGEGSFSTVYKGYYCGTEVAVKELKCKLSQDDKNYFHSEAALLQQLHHPRIVLLMGVCTSSAHPFMLLEYLSGGTLFSLIHKQPKERLHHKRYFFSIAKDVAQGMNYLHKHDPQVLHLDLKSMNVLLDSCTRAKIADFGFSILRRSRGGSSVIKKDLIRGTPAWMAPELLARGKVSPKCDVYSFSIILWEMITVSHPFQGLDIYQILETVEVGLRLPFPKSGISQELRELITSCWAQNPSLRPSFQEILGSLETLSLPVSRRKILTRRNVSPSLFSDINAPRALNGMSETNGILHHHLISRKEVCDKHRGFFASEYLKESKNWPSSPRRWSNAPKAHSPTDENNRDPFPKASFMTFGEIENHRRELLNQNRSNPDSNINIFRDIHHHRAWDQKRAKINLPSRDKQNRERLVKRDERGREREKKYNSRHHSISRSKKEETKCSAEECLYKNSLKKSEQSQSKSSGKEGGKINTTLNGCSMQLENHAVSQRPHERIPVYSPHRKSPQQRLNYTSKCEIECHQRPNSNQLHQGGIILTAEQLLSQKKRLRPVRGANLKHLSHLTQSSCNDISMLLKQAMTQRDALNKH